MTAIRKRSFARLEAAFVLFAVVTACSSAAPARSVALDPSNPDAEESPRMVARPDAAATPADGKPDVNADMSAGAGASPMPPEPHHHGGGAPAEKGAQ